MAPATAEKTEKKAATQTEHLYWFGALPAVAPIPYQFPTRERQGDGNFFEVKNVSAYTLWEKQNRIWIGKCRFLQTLAVKGLGFPAFTEMLERQATLEDEVSRRAFPGAVEIFRDSQVDGFVKSAWRHVIRYGKGCDDPMSLKNAANGGVSPVRIVNLDANDEKPANMKQAKFEETRIPLGEDMTFDEFRDIYMAHFVYLVKIEGDVKQFRNEKGELDLGACLPKLPNQSIDRRFFSAPPQSIAEMYPQP